MQKDTIFTPTSLVPKLFYPKKCVNYDNSEFSKNSVKGPKDQNSEKKMLRSNIKFHNMPGKATKNEKS